MVNDFFTQDLFLTRPLTGVQPARVVASRVATGIANPTVVSQVSKPAVSHPAPAGQTCGRFELSLPRAFSYALPAWKPAIGSLAPARSVLRTFALRANPFRCVPRISSRQVWKPAVRSRALAAVA